jgi:hypothetical protein
MEHVHTRAAAIILAALALMVAAIMSSNYERVRPLAYDKGSYSGTPDAGLDDSTVDTLRQRTDNYRNSGI